MRWFLFPISPHLGLGFLLPRYYLVAIVLDRVLPCSGLCLSWATALPCGLPRTQGDPAASASSVLGLKVPNTSSSFLSRSSTLVTTPGSVLVTLYTSSVVTILCIGLPLILAVDLCMALVSCPVGKCLFMLPS